MKILLIFLSLFVSTAFAAEIKDCHVGGDPWFKNRPVQVTDVEYVLKEPIVVESLNSKGKPSGYCRLLSGEHVVVPLDFDTSVFHPFSTREEKLKLAWIRKCGNPIVSPFRLFSEKKEEKTVSTKKRKSLLEGVDPNFNRTVFVPDEKQENVQITQVRVVVSPEVNHRRCWSGYNDCWYGTGYWGNQTPYYRNNYVTQTYVSPPQPTYSPPVFNAGPATSAPGGSPPVFNAGTTTSGPVFTAGSATSGPVFTAH